MRARVEKMKSLCKITLLACVLAAGSAYALDPLEQSLVDKATYWEQKGRGDLASESWKKLLQVNPEQPDALTGEGVYEAQLGHSGEARKYLEALRKSHPGHPGIARIENALQMGKVDTGKLNRELDEARRLAAERRYDEAAARYRQVFSGTPPQGDLALEYYQTLAGTSNGWEAARQGLAALVKSAPQNARYELAYAKHLSYHEGTRHEAIAMLARLSGNPAIAEDVRGAWRQALIWLNAAKSDNALYRAYLSRYPDDRSVGARLAEINKPALLGPEASAREHAFRELKGGELDTAEAGFRNMLKKKPGDADAVAGLAIVKLRRQEFGEARDLFRKAMKMAPGRAQAWNSGYRTASLWYLIGQAKSRPEKAESLLKEALAFDSGEHPALLALADLYAGKGMYPEAEKRYREVLKDDPGNAGALGGLAGVLVREGREGEARQLVDRLGPGKDLFKARVFDAMGDYRSAQAALENAMLADPENASIRLALARVYRKQGEVLQARSLIDGLLASDPQMPDALYASALLSADMGQWLDGLNTLEKIRQDDRTPAMADTQRRLWIAAQAERAAVFHRQGNDKLALDALKEAQSAAGKSLELSGMVASGYAKIGEDGVALGIMRHAISASPSPTVGMRLQYASILLQARQDVELGPLLNRLSAETLSPKESADLDNLRMGFALRQADLARENGNLARAYDFLSPELSVHPNDSRLQSALARIYNAAGDHATALSIYQGVLAREPGNMDALLSAAGAAIDVKDYAGAQHLVDSGLELDPENPRLLAVAGRVARAQGKDDIAIRYFRKALALEGQQPFGAGGLRLVEPMPIPGLLRTAPAINPFSGKPGSLPAFPRPSDPNELKMLPGPGAARPVPGPFAASPAVPEREVFQPGQEERKEQTLQGELDELRQKYGNSVAVGMSLRNRSGEAGMSQMLDMELPVRGEIHTGYSGKLTVSATPVTLSAGDLNMTDPGVARRFGSNVLNAAIPAGTIAQNASGVGLGIAYQAGSLEGDIGFSPLAFPRTNFIGGLKFDTRLDQDLSFGAELSRRPVTDSVLSYAGAVDPRTGQSWGGVTKNGLGLSFGYDVDALGAYAKGGFYRLVGANVSANNLFDASVGAYYYAIRNDDDILTVGANVTSQSYAKNLRYFTLGHGGYFSPQSYFSLGIPVEWNGRKEKLAYQVRTSVGIQSFREDSVPYFPLDAGLQAALQNLAAAALTTNYSGRNVTGFSYLLAGSVEYQLAPKFFLGGALSMDNASNYNQQIGLAYLRYSFLPQAGRIAFPPRVLNPYYPEQP